MNYVVQDDIHASIEMKSLTSFNNLFYVFDQLISSSTYTYCIANHITFRKYNVIEGTPVIMKVSINNRNQILITILL